MSKKIWRGQAGYNMMTGGIVHIDEKPADCTIVHDSACFPVKEAMAMIKGIYAVGHNGPALSEFLIRSLKKYDAAVERMRKKAGK